MKTTCLTIAFLISLCACRAPSTDEKQAEQQSKALEQAHSQIGMPAIGNFSERRMMKDLYELRDKTFPTHTYIVNEREGCLTYLGASIGYGLPYAAQYTAPTKIRWREGGGYIQVPQAEPNGLFMPDAAEGTWVMLKDPNGDDVKAVYIEPRIVVSPFKLPDNECPKR